MAINGIIHRANNKDRCLLQGMEMRVGYKVTVALLFVFCSLFGCETNSDMKWYSFTSTGRLIDMGFNSWTYEHKFFNLSSDKVALQYESGKDEHGFTNHTTRDISPNREYAIRITYYDTFTATGFLSCSVGTYDGRELVIENRNGGAVFNDK